MDAKANYPENRKPTWQCGSELSTSEEKRGELLRCDMSMLPDETQPQKSKKSSYFIFPYPFAPQGLVPCL